MMNEERILIEGQTTVTLGEKELVKWLDAETMEPVELESRRMTIRCYPKGEVVR